MGQWELTDFHSCPEQHMEHMDCQRVKKLSLFPVICQFSQYRNSIYLKPVLGAFLVVGLNQVVAPIFVATQQQCLCEEPFVDSSWFD